MENEEKEYVFIEPKRARRIRDNARLIRGYIRILKFYQFDETTDEINERARKFYNHFKNCSCWMCGNPRKFENALTFQEKRAIEDMKHQMKEAGYLIRGHRREKLQ
jgi:hypothetical protein